MLERCDRLAIAVPDRHIAAEAFAKIFDAMPVDDGFDPGFNANRLTLAWGQDQLELLDPAGDGPVEQFLREGKRGIFAGGFSSADPAAVAAQAEGEGLRVQASGPDRYVVTPDDGGGTGIILSARESRDRQGLNDKIWQITYVVDDLDDGVAKYSRIFGTGDLFTNRYTSDLYGYDGAITWFDAQPGGLLDSLEFLEPTDPEKAVARFQRRGGPGIYMASVETDALPQIRERVSRDGPGWDGTDDVLGFIHPLRLHGLLLAVVDSESWQKRRELPNGSD